MQDISRLKNLYIQVKRYKLDLVFKLFFSIFLIYEIFKKFDFNAFVDNFLLVDPFFLFLALLLTFITSIFYVLRLFLFLRKDYKIKFWRLYLINRIGNLFNFFLLGNFGQELSKFIYFKNLSKKKLIKILLFDRLSGLFSILVVLFFTLHLSPDFLKISLIHKYLMLIATIIIVFYILYWLKKKLEIKNYIFCYSLIISQLYALNLIFIAILTFRSISVGNVSLEMFYVIPLLSVLLMFPISINGIGLREYFLLFILSIAPEKIILYSLIGYVIFIILNLPGLFFYLTNKKT